MSRTPVVDQAISAPQCSKDVTKESVLRESSLDASKRDLAQPSVSSIDEGRPVRHSSKDSRPAILAWRLDDPTVIQCEDRGESDYNRNHPPTSHINPTHAYIPYHLQCAHESSPTARVLCDREEATRSHPDPNYGHKSLVELLRCELQESRVRYPPNSHSSFFIPRRKLQSIVTSYRVCQIIETLSCYMDPSDAEKDKVRDEMCFGDKQCWKLLLVLLITNKQEDIMDLVKDGASDQCLPIGVGRSSYCVGHSDQITHPTIKRWSADVRKEATRWSYAVKAPYFTRRRGRHNHNILDRNYILPIHGFTPDAPLIHHRSGSDNGTVDGGFGQVTRVALDESHYDFEDLAVRFARLSLVL